MSEFTVRGLGGTITVDLPEGSTVADVREAAAIAEGIVLRQGGTTVLDEAGTQATETLVSAPAEAKQG